MKKGIVKWYSQTKGYGFVVCDDKEYFMHATSIPDEEHKALIKKGDKVEFELKDPTQPGKNQETNSVRIIS